MYETEGFRCIVENIINLMIYDERCPVGNLKYVTPIGSDLVHTDGL